MIRYSIRLQIDLGDADRLQRYAQVTVQPGRDHSGKVYDIIVSGGQ